MHVATCLFIFSTDLTARDKQMIEASNVEDGGRRRRHGTERPEMTMYSESDDVAQPVLGDDDELCSLLVTTEKVTG